MQDIKDDPTQSCSHEQSITRQDWGVNQQTALLMAQYLWRLLRHGKCGHHVQYFDIADGELSSLDIDPQMWQTFNYIEQTSTTH
jgi:hypothetical protein